MQDQGDIIKSQMNLLKGDSLLSNISNVSVKILDSGLDGSCFFKKTGFTKWMEDEKEINVADIPEDFNDVENLMNYEGVSEELSHHQIEERTLKIQIKSESAVADQEMSEQNESVPDRRQTKNQTKNIPKNYGKAIITFIEKYKAIVMEITRQHDVDYNQFLDELRERKKTINTIADLRNLWVDYKHAKCMRVLSNLFLRKYALQYIFNSRICNYSSHIKYRHRMREAIENPDKFRHIKDY